MIKKMFLRRRKGFTLIELLIVVAIIGVLAGIAIPNFLSARTKAKVSREFADMRNVANGLEMIYLDNTTYPADNNAVIAAISGYVSSIPSDPFNPKGTRTKLPAGGWAITTNSYGYVMSTGNQCWLLLANGPNVAADINSNSPAALNWTQAYRVAGNIGGDETTKSTAGNDAYNAINLWCTSTVDTSGDIGRGGP